MNPKTLQYLMGHSDIGVTMNTYTHLGLDDAKDEMIRLEELEQARKEVEKTLGTKPIQQTSEGAYESYLKANIIQLEGRYMLHEIWLF